MLFTSWEGWVKKYIFKEKEIILKHNRDRVLRQM